jgi:RNA polymerase sigma-70 factor (ECF subfamily)
VENTGTNDETVLVESVRQGDASAFDELVRRYMRRAFSVAFHILRHREDAEDLVQEAFMTVLQKIGTFDVSRPFAPWLFRIVANRALNARKSRALRATDEIPGDTASGAASPALSLERAEVRERFGSALDELPERRQLVMRLFELEGFSSPEIAAMLDISEATVRWHLMEARKSLREALRPFRESWNE